MPEKIIIRDWPRLQQYLEGRLQQGGISTVSLDIFDTLLARIETPEQVQRGVCRLLAEKLGRGFSATQVWQVRQSCERALREQAAAAGMDYECRFSELVPCWLERLTGAADEERVSFVCDTESELEKLALYVKPGAGDFLNWLAQQPLRVLAVSDMYLDSSFLRDLLIDKELYPYFAAVYVSADSGLCKYSGRLFRHIAEQQGLGLDESWVHIGDNPLSDRRAACEAGIQGILLYEKAALREREQQQLNVRMAQYGGIWKGQHFFSMLEQRLQADNTPEFITRDGGGEQDFFYRYGRDVLGGAFSAFTLGLQERLQRKPVEKLFFVARDGFLFRQLYHQLDDRVPDEYIYLSRKVITAASTADGLTLEQAQVAFYNPKQQGLRSVCKVYGLPEAGLLSLAARHGFSEFAEPLSDWHDSRLLSFLADEEVQAYIRPIGKQHRDLLEAYLEQVGFLGTERVGLVDIGWNGTVQKFLKQAFGERADFPQVQGYYFAFVPKMYNDFGRDNVCEGIIHDSRRDNACERIPAEFEEIFEQGARAQEATTIAYRKTAEGIVPVFKSGQSPDRRAEIECNPLVAAMQAGVMDHWRHFRAVQRLSGYSGQDILPYIYGQLERAIVYPDRQETQMLTRLVHTEDFGDDHVLDLGRQPLAWRDWLQPLRLWRRLRDSAWRYALFSGGGSGVGNFVLRVAYLHAVKK